jgi:hypothetical protein
MAESAASRQRQKVNGTPAFRFRPRANFILLHDERGTSPRWPRIPREILLLKVVRKARGEKRRRHALRSNNRRRKNSPSARARLAFAKNSLTGHFRTANSRLADCCYAGKGVLHCSGCNATAQKLDLRSRAEDYPAQSSHPIFTGARAREECGQNGMRNPLPLRAANFNVLIVAGDFLQPIPT